MTGLYVHIPFCVSKCYYCDFYSEAGKLDMLEAYVDALLIEAKLYKGALFNTLYIGGGTPSLLGVRGLESLIAGLSRCFDLTNLEEATIEVNPESADTGFLQAALACGINRLSIGVQSLNNSELKKAGRIHNAQQAIQALSAAFDCGFENVSADIIIGLPGQTQQGLEDTLHNLVSTGLAHISAYCLSVEDGTAFAQCPPKDLVDDESQAGMFEFAAGCMKQHGYVHYEISNFAVPGSECLHNLNYWRGGEYLGLGPGAASHIKGKRFKNAACLDQYIHDTAAVEREEEVLDAAHKSAEEAMLRLRLLQEGLDLASLSVRYGQSNIGCLSDRLNKLAGEKMLVKAGNKYRLPPDKVLTSNQVFIQVIN